LSPSDSLRLIGPMERAIFLRSLGPAGELPLAEIAVFAEHARERRFRAGEALFRRGRRAEAYHVIVDGAVHASGGEFLEGTDLGPRDAVAFHSMLAQRPEGVEAVAVEDTVTLEFDEDVLLDILEDHFPVTLGLLSGLARRTLEYRRRIPPGTYLAPMEGRVRWSGRPLDLVERIMMIRRPGAPFANASLDAITQLARTTHEVQIAPGTTLWKSGDRADHALIVVQGTITCTTQWGISRFRVGPGYPLGNLERLSGDPRWYTAVTETPLVAFRSDTEPTLDVLEDHFDMALGLIRAMAGGVIRLAGETAATREGVAAA
jgi:CRP-like cAMP-binding protein